MPKASNNPQPQGEEEENILTKSYTHGDPFITSPQHRSQPWRTFLFGNPIAHSMAPLLHERLFTTGINCPSWRFDLHETPNRDEFLPLLQTEEGIAGCAVTMPYKVALMGQVDELTEEARVIGAINTVFLRRRRGGNGAGSTIKYIGTNTDCIGVREAFLQNFPRELPRRSKGRPGMVIGGGGACRAAIFALGRWMGCSEIYVVNRLESEVREVVESLKGAGFRTPVRWVGSVEEVTKKGEFETPVVIVGTVPDFVPREPGEILVRDIVTAVLDRDLQDDEGGKGFVLEMCYHPQPRTAFYKLAVEKGWAVLFGTESMIWQGVAQEVLWTELPLSEFRLEEAQRAVMEAVAKH